MEKNRVIMVCTLIILLGMVIGFLLGIVCQQMIFLTGAVKVAEGLEGTNIEVNIDLNETQLVKGIKEEFMPFFNETINNNLEDSQDE